MTHDPEQVRRWALVLESQGIPYEISRQPEGWDLVVPPSDAVRAAAALSEYQRENEPAAAATVERPVYSRSYVAVTAAALLVAFHALTGPWSDASRWFASGAADAELVRSGEVWRLVTALTLHADMAHVLANAVSLALFGTAVMAITGSGVGTLLILLSGVIGNGLNVMTRWSVYSGVGASTAVFGAIGVLTGTQMLNPDRRLGRTWTAVASGVLLLVLLGMGEHTDVMAHALGFASGIALGTAWSKLSRPRIHGVRQHALVALAAACVVLCWSLALAATG